MMNLEMCKECGSGNTAYDAEYNRFHCTNCGNTAYDAPGESREKAAKVWNECNDPSLTMDQLKAMKAMKLVRLWSVTQH